MSNPDNQFDTLTQEEFLAAWGTYLQGKVDKRGGAVSPEGSNTRLAASWMNLVDDLILSTINGNLQPSPIVENTAAPLAIPTISMGSTYMFTFDVPTTANNLELLWWSLTRTAPASGSVDGLTFSMFSRTTRGDNELMHHAVMPENTSGGVLDFSPTPSGKFLRDAFARELEEIVADHRRIYCAATNTGTAATPPLQLAYAMRASNLTLTEIPEQ